MHRHSTGEKKLYNCPFSTSCHCCCCCCATVGHGCFCQQRLPRSAPPRDQTDTHARTHARTHAHARRRLSAIAGQLSPGENRSGIQSLEADTFKLQSFMPLTGMNFIVVAGRRKLLLHSTQPSERARGRRIGMAVRPLLVLLQATSILLR